MDARPAPSAGQGLPFPTMRVPYLGRYRYVYDFERHAACAGEVVTVFGSAASISPAVIILRRSTVLDEMRAYPIVAPDNPLPDPVRVGRWHVSISIVSHCANREWAAPVAHFDIAVVGS
ncbi:hypothetical protein QO001_004210 [Methylobacterium brachiatum]|uniref:Uncharacterized protein n=1 Tax=Methylobacterium brachiatum TaxID=269660 RepID=A0AAJ1TXG7_9HYPH|nr:hypothetical protein [Methylobacterium brachiatum]MCB4804255.1 hypothetical protein [Methylobacterium brachiatum]MDQ0545267.1 hypothetical protein [Methylobacterium brachiatum]